jgi:hypothetical protein
LEQARRIVDHLLTHGARDVITPEDVTHAFAACEGNSREMLFTLYDIVEQRERD